MTCLKAGLVFMCNLCMTPPIPPPHNVASAAMAVALLRSALSQRGLWIVSLAAWAHEEGLESLEDLWCSFVLLETLRQPEYLCSRLLGCSPLRRAPQTGL